MTMMAGIPARFGYGYGIQRWLLNRPPRLPASVLRWHPFDQATEFLRMAGIPMLESEPVLRVAAAAAETVRLRIGILPVAIGIGSSEPYKQWGATRFAALADALAAGGAKSIVLVGGMAEAALVAEIQASARSAAITSAISWNLPEIAALLSLSAFYVGNDTGFMNMAAAVGVRTYALFGAVSPIRHASQIVAITPPGGISMIDGMARITVKQVLAAIDADQTEKSVVAGFLRPINSQNRG
jgi:heptosyltransferase II